MTDKVAALIVNYNMPERTDALYHALSKSKWPLDIYVIDNGSDLVAPSQFTNVWLPTNRQTTAGWLAGLNIASDTHPYFAYWFHITSAEYPTEGDHLTPLAEWLTIEPNAVAVHPALTDDSTTTWVHIRNRHDFGYRRTWMVDNIAALYRADWFDKIGRFDPEMKYAWGIDLETCYKARKEGRSLWICEDVQVRKVTNIGYAMDRMNMSSDERGRLAGANMREVLAKKYGPGYWDLMMEGYVEDAWR
jgi:hypothetical protein